jgi:serine/threonine kinase 3
MASPSVRKSNEKDENVISAGEGLIDRMLGDVGKYSSTKQLIIGGISGWCMGFITMKVGKAAAFALGGVVMLLQIATHKGYIQVNWDHVYKQADKVTDILRGKTTGQGPTLMEKVNLSLSRQPEEVFDIICKLGEGSYGSVYKALHKKSGQVLAIKQVPVYKDLQEIIKEISIMQQCDSPWIVKFYGSYFKNTDLWIVMEYCGAGSVSDIMKLLKKTLTEDEIATILCDTLKGLEYLHLRRKIHRDIKAANILLNTEGHAKLADFGVSAQLTDTTAKRTTVIGTPFWMAPEVIQEIGHDCVADIWSLGITALEMAESKPPYGDIHPVRAIFMIPTKPPPSFREPDQWSPEFIDFVSQCLVKNPEKRATSTKLLHHEFVANAKQPHILEQMIAEALEIRENQSYRNNAATSAAIGAKHNYAEESDEDDVLNSKTMVHYPQDSGTLAPSWDLVECTVLPNDTGTSEANNDAGTVLELQSDLATMVINSDTEEEPTMKRHDTGPGESGKQYRPLFLDHFDKKEAESFKGKGRPHVSPSQRLSGGDMPTDAHSNASPNAKVSSPKHSANSAHLQHKPSTPQQAPQLSSEERQRFQKHFQRQLKQISGTGRGGALHHPPTAESFQARHHQENQPKFQRAFGDSDVEFLKFLSYEELRKRMAKLDVEMEQEMDVIRRRYQTKRQPLLDAMEQKRKRQQNFCEIRQSCLAGIASRSKNSSQSKCNLRPAVLPKYRYKEMLSLKTLKSKAPK